MESAVLYLFHSLYLVFRQIGSIETFQMTHTVTDIQITAVVEFIPGVPVRLCRGLRQSLGSERWPMKNNGSERSIPPLSTTEPLNVCVDCDTQCSVEDLRASRCEERHDHAVSSASPAPLTCPVMVPSLQDGGGHDAAPGAR